MDTVNENSGLTSPTQVTSSIEATPLLTQPQHVPISSQPRNPSLHFVKDKSKYLEQCVPIYKHALKGHWNMAKAMIIDIDNALVNAAITPDWWTLLHVAAGTDHVHFVEELVKLLNPHDLELQNFNGNKALFMAAVSGNLILVKKNGCLPHIRGVERVTPLYMAVYHGRSEMATYLYSQTADILEEEEQNALFFLCINTDLYGLALQMLEKLSTLALVLNENNEIGLHVLARKPYYRVQVMNTSGMQASQYLQLVESLWGILLKQSCSEALRTIITHPSQITFDATENGNFHFVAEIMRLDPDLIWEVDSKNRTIIHIAVLHRHSDIFSLIHQLASFKDLIVCLEDDEENNILHYAAKLAPPRQLNLIAGEALQMTHELLWFQEVKKLMLPSEIEKKNSSGKTADELFKDEHKELLAKAVSWTETTTKNCMIISTLISTGVLTATFNLPGGHNKITGTPNYLQKPAFLIFAVSIAIALISSSVSMLIFLSILVSSYAEYHYFNSLPFKLLSGLIAQIISIISLMIAFSVSFYITCYHGLVWVPYFVSVIAFLPIPLKFLVIPLWSDIINSSYFCMSLFQPGKHMLN